VSADSEYERLAALLREHRPTRAVALLAALEDLYSDAGERLDALRSVVSLACAFDVTTDTLLGGTA
jgi:hypothetical protein